MIRLPIVCLCTLYYPTVCVGCTQLGCDICSRDALLKGSISTVDLLVLTSLDKLLFKLKLIFPFFKTTYLNEEVNFTESSTPVRAPWLQPDMTSVIRFFFQKLYNFYYNFISGDRCQKSQSCEINTDIKLTDCWNTIKHFILFVTNEWAQYARV